MVETVAHSWPVDDTGCRLLRFASGALGAHSTTLTSRPRYDFVEVDGTAGKLILDPMEHWADRVRWIRPDGKNRFLWNRSAPRSLMTFAMSQSANCV